MASDRDPLYVDEIHLKQHSAKVSALRAARSHGRLPVLVLNTNF